MYINSSNCQQLTGLTELEIKKLTGIEGYTSNLSQWHIHFTDDFEYPLSRVLLIGDGKLKISRLFNFQKKSIWNEYLELPGDMRNNGIGFRMFESQINEAMAANFNLIRCLAARDTTGKNQMDGYVVWAKVGYSMHQNSIPAYTERLDEHSIGFQQLHDLIYCTKLENGDSGENFWVEHGLSWYAQFELDINSVNHTLLQRYKERKANKSKS